MWAVRFTPEVAPSAIRGPSPAARDDRWKEQEMAEKKKKAKPETSSDMRTAKGRSELKQRRSKSSASSAARSKMLRAA